MSYARLADPLNPSDVYVFMDTGGWLECHWCRVLYEDHPAGSDYDGQFRAHSTAAMIAHLQDHMARGHRIPDHVIPEMEADDAENFPEKGEGSG